MDHGGRLLAGQVLEAAGRGDQDMVADLVAPLDVDQLRALVGVLAAQVDESLPEVTASTPTSVCDLAVEASAEAFGVAPEAILSKDRSRPVSDARAVAMTVARETSLSLRAIADHFNKDHGSVVHAIKRTADRPRLADAAARISDHVQARYTAHLQRPSPTTAIGDGPTSEFRPSNIVEHAVASAAEVFDTTPEMLLGPSRTRAAVDARSVAMAVARLHDQSLPRIARHFSRDHTTVLSATRRVENTPPLHALAIEIAKDLPTGPDAIDPASTSGHVTPLPSPGARHEQRDLPAQQTQPNLRIAR